MKGLSYLTPGRAYFFASGIICVALVCLVSLARPRPSLTEADLRAGMDRLRAELFAESGGAAAALRSWQPAELAMARTSDTLVRPDFALPHSGSYSFVQLAESKELAGRCNREAINRFKQDAVSLDVKILKLLTWIEFRCGIIQALPVDFFERAPFMHPSGVSYRYLWAGNEASRFDPRYLHVTELEKSESGRQWLAEHVGSPSLSRQDYGFIARRAPIVQIAGFVHVLKESLQGESYSVFTNADFVKAAAQKGICLDDRTKGLVNGLANGLSIGNIAFVACAERWILPRSVALGGSVVSLVALVALFFLVVFGSARTRQQERKREQFMLRMLAHELRTPATAIQLALRNIESDFALLSERGQEALIRLQGAQGRLNGVLEASKHYVISGLKLADSSEVSPVNECIRSCLGNDDEDPPGDISIQLLESDEIAARIDPFWLLFCLSNILDNVRRHGKPPLSVVARLEGVEAHRPMVAISVRDAGEGMPDTLAQEGSGMGIGLSLVQEVLLGFGGRIIISSRPTTVTLLLGVAK